MIFIRKKDFWDFLKRLFKDHQRDTSLKDGNATTRRNKMKERERRKKEMADKSKRKKDRKREDWQKVAEIF